MDTIVMRFADVLLAFPAIVLSLMFVSILGPQQWLIIVAVAVSHFPRTLRVVRGSALSVVERDFIRYGEAIGLRRVTTVVREILPNVAGALMVEVGIRFTFSIGLVASLDFLGVGVQPPTADWGLMINENRIGLSIQPWGVVLPLIAIAAICMGSNLIADGIARVMGGLEDSRS
jgi:peptide/nickel transport system permease protein